MVLLKLQPYAQSSVVNRPCHKLAYKFSGPYKVLERIGSTAYKLDLPPYSHIHPVFHVSQLKPFTPNSAPVFSDLPTSVALDISCSEPSQILERRLVKKGDSSVVRVRVPWTRLPDSIATWEDFYNLKARFPAAAAIWRQPVFQGGGSVMSQSDAVTDRTQEATANGEGAKMGADGNSDVGLDETEARQQGATQNSVANSSEN